MQEFVIHLRTYQGMMDGGMFSLLIRLVFLIRKADN